jgi:hypothetical protein
MPMVTTGVERDGMTSRSGIIAGTSSVARRDRQGSEYSTESRR